MQHPFFFIGLSLVLIHEMDAITCSEWRILPGLSMLGEKAGYLVFVALHAPLYFFILANLHTANALNVGLIRGLSIFFIAHFFAHLLLLRHPKNQFKSTLSWTIIFGCGMAGFLDLITGF